MNVEGPLSSNSTFLFSARRSYLDFIFRAAGFGFVPEYWDFLGKVNYRLGAHDQISFLGIGVIDQVRMFNDTEKQRFDNSTILSSTQHQLVSGSSWKHIFSNGYSLISVNSVYADFEYYQSDTSLASIFRNNSKEYEVALRGEVVFQFSRNTEISTGFQVKHIKFSSEIAIPPFQTSTGEQLNLNVSYATRATKSAVFLQLSQNLDRIRAILGGRLDYFDLITKKVVFSPRFALSYALTPVSTLTGSAGVFQQAPSYIWLVSDPSNRDLTHTRVYGTLSISYNETWFTAFDGVERPSSFDQRWIINIGGGYSFNEMWDANLKFRFATGRPYTPFNPDGTQDPLLTNTVRVPLNHSLDLRIDRRWMFSRWTLITYIDIQNVYNRKPYDVPRYNVQTRQREDNQSIGILPSIGISAEF